MVACDNLCVRSNDVRLTFERRLIRIPLYSTLGCSDAGLSLTFLI